MRLFRYRLLLPVLWMIIMFWFSNRPSITASNVDLYDFIIKKTAHVSEYAILVALWVFAMGKNNLSRAIFYSLIYAFSDETHQLFIPGRTGAIRDVGIDSIGIAISSLLISRNKWKGFTSPTPTKKHSK